MSERKQRPLWPLLTAAMIGLPVLYVAGFAVCCWIEGIGRMPGDAIVPLKIVYWPIIELANHGPKPIRAPIGWIVDTLARPDCP